MKKRKKKNSIGILLLNFYTTFVIAFHHPYKHYIFISFCYKLLNRKMG